MQNQNVFSCLNSVCIESMTMFATLKKISPMNLRRLLLLTPTSSFLLIQKSKTTSDDQKYVSDNPTEINVSKHSCSVIKKREHLKISSAIFLLELVQEEAKNLFVPKSYHISKISI